MAAFPGSLPVFTGFTSAHTLSQDAHASQHNLEQAEIVNIATKIGTGSSTPTSGTVMRGTGVGTSAWGQVALTTDVTGVLPVANGGTGVTTTTGTGKLVYDTSPTLNTPTLTTPVISDFTSSTHTHANNSGGGTLVGRNALQTSTVDDAQLKFGKVRSRQGGSATDWNTVGSTTYDYSGTNTFIQCGTIFNDGSPKTINFPVAFTNKPLIILTVSSVNAASCFAIPLTVTTTSFTCQVYDNAGATNNAQNINWIAIGE